MNAQLETSIRVASKISDIIGDFHYYSHRWQADCSNTWVLELENEDDLREAASELQDYLISAGIEEDEFWFNF